MVAAVRDLRGSWCHSSSRYTLHCLIWKEKREVITEENVIEEGEEKLEVVALGIGLSLTRIRGVGPKRSEKLKAAGIRSVNDLVDTVLRNWRRKSGFQIV